MKSPAQVVFLLLLSTSFGCGAALSTDELKKDPTAAESDTKGFPLTGRHVVCYNVENLFDTKDDPATNDQDFLPGSAMQWTEERLALKLDHLAEAIGLAGDGYPALIGLVEVENKQVVERLVNETALRGARYTIVHQDSPDERGIDVALCFDPSALRLVNSEFLEVSLDEDRTRDILHAELNGGELTFHVFVNHWPSRRGGPAQSEPKRMAAAKVLRDAIEKVRTGTTTHVLVMGDFNDTPNDQSIQEGLGAGCSVKGERLVDLMCMEQPAGHGSYLYRGAWDYLDQFIVDPSLLPQVKKASALWNENLLFRHPKYGLSPDKTYSGGHYKGGYSDHLPIVLEFN